MLELIAVCAPDVAPNTIARIIEVESRGNPLALNVNGLSQEVKAKNQKHAVELLKQYLTEGYSVDVGLMQINSSNFAVLGYSEDRYAELFEPCTNIYLGSLILKDFYRRSRKIHQDSFQTLQAALSAYNTGSFTRGFKNGYVAKVYQASQSVSPTESQAHHLHEALHAPTAVSFKVNKQN